LRKNNNIILNLNYQKNKWINKMNFHRMKFQIKYDNKLKINENTIQIIIIYCINICFAFDYCDLLIYCDLYLYYILLKKIIH